MSIVPLDWHYDDKEIVAFLHGISHHLSLGWYLEYHKISPWESVHIY
jgi:hypothetical protein